jgi:hypothetical protein
MRSATGRRLQGCTHVCGGRHGGAGAGWLEIESGYGLLLKRAQTRCLLFCSLCCSLQIRRRYHDLHLFALLCCPYPSTLPTPPPPTPLLPHRPRACSCSSQPARALSTLRPAAEVKSSASTARPTAHRPLCRSTLFDRALRNESTPPRPRLYNHPDHRSPLANAAAAVSIPTPAKTVPR